MNDSIEPRTMTTRKPASGPADFRLLAARFKQASDLTRLSVLLLLGDGEAVKTDRYGHITHPISRVKSVSPAGQVMLANGERSRPNGVGLGERPFGAIVDFEPESPILRPSVGHHNWGPLYQK